LAGGKNTADKTREKVDYARLRCHTVDYASLPSPFGTPFFFLELN
jgi:hypothetical protein